MVSGLFCLAVKLAASAEQIDERHLVRLRDLGHGGGVELEPAVVARRRRAGCGPCRFSCAMGENRTSRGVRLPLYFCASVS